MKDRRIFVNINFLGKQFKVDGVLGDEFIELNFPNGNDELINAMYPHFFDHINCFSYEGNSMLLENIKPISKQTRFNSNMTVDTIRYSYDTIILNPSKDNLYSLISFKIDKANLLFKLKSFETRFFDEYEVFLGGFDVVGDKINYFKFYENCDIAIFRTFDNFVRSETLFDLNVNQYILFMLKYKTPTSVDVIRKDIDCIKSYIEFLINETTTVYDVVGINSGNELDTKFTTNKCELYRGNKIIRFRDSEDAIKDNIVGWREFYTKYYESFNLWKKTIYNVTIDNNDIFIWECQALECLCQLDEHLYSVAKRISEERAKENGAKNTSPNIIDYLTVVSDIIGNNIFNKYFKLVKNTRDKYTHYNPNKYVNLEQVKTAKNIIDFFFISLIYKYFLGDMKNALSLLVNPDVLKVKK